MGLQFSARTFTWIRRRSAYSICLLFALVGFAASAPAEPPPLPSLEEVANAFGISDDDLEALKQGKRVGGELTSVSENELALTMAVWVPTKPETLLEHVEQDDGFESDPTVIQHSRIDGDTSAALEKLNLPRVEIERLANAEAGDEINLSGEEIESLQSVMQGASPGEARDLALVEAFRRILAERVEAFRKGGLAAIVPYDRGDGEFGRPGAELERALGELDATRKLAPRVMKAVTRPSASVSEGVNHRFYWAVNGADDEILVSLIHRTWVERENHIILVEHRFYVNQTVNSMQAVAVAVPFDGGSIVIYANRTFTDRVAGFASGVARSIGRTLMRSKITELMDAFEQTVESPAGG